jgi:MSHA pilin protein MshC
VINPNVKGIAVCIKARGFSLIELLMVLLILAIISITVLPKFFTSKGFAEYAYQDDVITKLRLIQTQAMQQTNNNANYCHTVLITTKQIGIADNCINFALPMTNSTTRVSIDNMDEVNFSSNVTGNTLTLTAWGDQAPVGPVKLPLLARNLLW